MRVFNPTTLSFLSFLLCLFVCLLVDGCKCGGVQSLTARSVCSARVCFDHLPNDQRHTQLVIEFNDRTLCIAFARFTIAWFECSKEILHHSCHQQSVSIVCDQYITHCFRFCTNHFQLTNVAYHLISHLQFVFDCVSQYTPRPKPTTTALYSVCGGVCCGCTERIFGGEQCCRSAE